VVNNFRIRSSFESKRTDILQMFQSGNQGDQQVGSGLKSKSYLLV